MVLDLQTGAIFQRIGTAMARASAPRLHFFVVLSVSLLRQHRAFSWSGNELFDFVIERPSKPGTRKLFDFVFHSSGQISLAQITMRQSWENLYIHRHFLANRDLRCFPFSG
jgi:hypothetical protein